VKVSRFLHVKMCENSINILIFAFLTQLITFKRRKHVKIRFPVFGNGFHHSGNEFQSNRTKKACVVTVTVAPPPNIFGPVLCLSLLGGGMISKRSERPSGHE